MNLTALIATLVLALAFLAIFGALYLIAARSHARGEIGSDGLRILRWGLLGHMILYVLLTITVFLT